VCAEFNLERIVGRIVGRTWPTRMNHVVLLELRA
jgi:hypothetical protein